MTSVLSAAKGGSSRTAATAEALYLLCRYGTSQEQIEAVGSVRPTASDSFASRSSSARA